MSSNLRWHASSGAFALEQRLVAYKHAAFVLDGDNVRHGLCADLNVSIEARSENIRRVAEVESLFNDAGIVSICSLISPYFRDREMALKIIGKDKFLEVHVSPPSLNVNGVM